MQYRSSAALALMGALVGTAAIAEKRGGLSAPEHGPSTLDITVEGTRVAMALRAPGLDIVGFKQAAATNEQQAAVSRAKIALADPLALFVLPRVARCRLIEAMAQLEMEAHKQGRKDAPEPGSSRRARPSSAPNTALDCANPVALDWIIFRFFERFANARVVEVTLVTGHGRAAFRVGRAMPRIVFERLT